MSDLLIHIYQYFRRRKAFFVLFLLGISGLVFFLASQIRFKEDISQSVSGGDKNDTIGMILRNLKMSDKLVIDLTLTDSLDIPDPDGLESCGQSLVDSLNSRFDSNYIRSITFKTSDSAITAMMNLVIQHLPAFIDESDYKFIDSLILPGSIEQAVGKNYRTLMSPASMILKKRIQQDPLGISNIAFAKLKSLKADENFELYNGCVFSRDLRHLLIFMVPANSSSETSKNDDLIKGLDEVISTIPNDQHSGIKIQYFGGPAVAVCNARQLKKDITLTLMIAVVLIFLLVGWYFKSVMVPLLGLLPALFGGALALAVLFIVKGSISAISLGIGSVILGLIVDYCLYLVNHFRLNRDMELTLKEMSLTIFLCSLTSAGAFLCLTFLNSGVLQDLGWFAAVSVMGAALFTLLVLPQMMSRKTVHGNLRNSVNIIDKLAAIRYEKKWWLVAGLIVSGILSTWFSQKVEFDKNIAALSYVTPKLAKAEADLDKISNYKLKNLYLVATGPTIEQALRNKEHLALQIETLSKSNVIEGISSAGSLLTSDSLQKQKIERWNRFWSKTKKQQLKSDLIATSQKLGFRPSAFESFFQLLDKEYKPVNIAELDIDNNPLLVNWLTVNPEIVMAPSILKVREEKLALIYTEFPPASKYVIFDMQSLTQRFIDNVKHDFDLLVTLSMIFVTLLLIVSFGRLGLGLLTALPMFFSWLITLGFMAFTGTRFNIFNIIISSFIFGLGVDYSILMMRGLQNSLKSGKDDLQTYKVSVLLSSLTTLLGVGVLFFTRHPALHSIALIAVFGILSVVFLSFTFQPLVFNGVILNRHRTHKFPVTFGVVIKTFVTWGNIVFIAFILMVAGGMIKLLLPLKRERKEMLFHKLFNCLTKAYIAFTFAFDRKLINQNGEDFIKPAVIISNHQSLIETPAFLRLYPNIIILTTTWVYRSPIFGPIARLASFYNVDLGIDNIIDMLKEKVNKGFSILIFPEAHRSSDHKIQRFHRGAFYLAEKLQIDILPIIVFGTGDFLGKGAFWGRPNSFIMKILKRVPFDDPSFGTTYQERTKLFRKFYIEEYAKIKAAEGDGKYYRRLLALNYVLKGPILEWYMRVKMKLEDNYDIYNKLMPRHGRILDLGCGYGFISYMLLFTGDDRQITGVDYDDEKIRVAQNCFSKTDQISFVTKDVSEFEITPKDGFLLGDVLHYLDPEKQNDLLRKCCMNLSPGGTILIREANAELEDRHKRSMLTEFFSTNIGFNKTRSGDKKLHYTSAEQIRAIADAFGLSMEIIDTKRVTSNNLFVITKKMIITG